MGFNGFIIKGEKSNSLSFVSQSDNEQLIDHQTVRLLNHQIIKQVDNQVFRSLDQIIQSLDGQIRSVVHQTIR